jgi:hypothetical protein
VVRDLSVPRPVLALVSVVVSLAKGTGPKVGTWFASQDDLAAASGLKVRWIRDLLHELRDHGYLEETRRGGYKRAAEYRLTLPPTGSQLPVAADPTGSQLPVAAEIQPALVNGSERNPTGTQGPTKREVLTREKNISPPPPKSAPAALAVVEEGGGEDRDELEAELSLFIRASAFLGGDEMPPDIEGVTAAAVASVFVDLLGFQLTASERRRLVSRLRQIPEDQLTAVVDHAAAVDAPPGVAHPLAFALARLDRAERYVAEFGPKALTQGRTAS